MPDEIITPHATPIATEGQPTWYPPPQDDNEQHQPQRRGVRWVFIGKDGLRAGWSLVLWIVLISLLSLPVNLALRHVIPRHAGRPGGPPIPEWVLLGNSVISFLLAGAAAYIVSRVERRPFAQYGLGTLRGRGGQFGTGLLLGFAALSLLVGVLWKSGFATFGGLHLHGAGTIALWAAVYFIAFLFTGFFEEFAFRGFLQFTLTRGIAGMLRNSSRHQHAGAIAFWITAVLLAVAFGAVHAGNAGEGRIGIVSAGLIGLLFAFSLWRTGSLWWAIGLHAAWDWAESYFYGTPDSGLVLPHRLLTTETHGPALYSGGTIGPEGSIFVFAVILLLAVLVALTLKPQPGSASKAMQQS